MRHVGSEYNFSRGYQKWPARSGSAFVLFFRQNGQKKGAQLSTAQPRELDTMATFQVGLFGTLDYLTIDLCEHPTTYTPPRNDGKRRDVHTERLDLQLSSFLNLAPSSEHDAHHQRRTPWIVSRCKLIYAGTARLSRHEDQTQFPPSSSLPLRHCR